MAELDVNGQTYYFEVAGTGPPLVLLHGFTGSGANWQHLVPLFAERYRTITIDLLGHGRTSAPPDPHRYGMAEVAADVAALLDAVAAQPVHLLGYSMGGRLALFMAVTAPERVRSLVLESSSPGLDTEEGRAARRQRDSALADSIEREGIPAFVGKWEKLPLFASQNSLRESIRHALRQQRLRNRAPGLANSLRGMGTGRQPSLWGRLDQLNAPVLILAGAQDEKFAAIGRRMAKLLPDARLEVVPEAGHTIHLEQPQEFSSRTLACLQEQRLQ